jgi:hypothetical protein
MPNNPTCNPLPTIGKRMPADLLYTFSIRGTSAKLPPPKYRLFSMLGGSRRRLAEVDLAYLRHLPPPNYLRRIFPLFSTLGGSRRR